MDTASAANAEPLPGLHRQAIRLEQFSIAWMLIEAGVAVTAGIIAASLALTSFGFASAIDLATRAHPERSPIGIGLTVASLLVMPLLGWRKRRVGTSLRNQLVLADAAETILCATLAATTLLGLVLFAAFSWWWADPVAALAVAYFAVREGREAWNGELVCDD
jgi:divalent metal cation (Fe/Co/Zn/Cd) transporter